MRCICLTQTLRGVAQSPIVGGWSDSTGRKPFLIAAMAMGFAPAMVLVLNIQFGVSLFWCAARSTPSIGSEFLVLMADIMQAAF